MSGPDLGGHAPLDFSAHTTPEQWDEAERALLGVHDRDTHEHECFKLARAGHRNAATVLRWAFDEYECPMLDDCEDDDCPYWPHQEPPIPPARVRMRVKLHTLANAVERAGAK